MFFAGKYPRRRQDERNQEAGAGELKEDKKMSVNAMGMGSIPTTETYASYGTSKADTAARTDSAAAESTATTDQAAKDGVVYDKSDKSDSSSTKATYSVNKMSKEDRAALVEQLKADQQARQQQLTDLVKQMMNKQVAAYGKASDDDMWKFLASGNYTVDAQAKLDAQQAISEDGYYGVKQTSERLFDFASALAGDDVDKMKEMQKAMEKGFKLATKSWGRDLPDISQRTLEAANKKFEDYYASKKAETENKTEDKTGSDSMNL